MAPMQYAMLITQVVTPVIDTGQLIVAGAIATSAWFIKREITRVGNRLDKHETRINELVGDVQRLIGLSQYWTGAERRHGK